jgi:hypothetical protein
MRFEAEDLGEFEAKLSVEGGITEPGRDIAEYRFRLHRARRNLVRERVGAVVSQIDELSSRLAREWLPDNSGSIDDPDWPALTQAIAELDRLVGSVISREGRWSELRRHAHFGQSQDLYDIVEMDWPSIRRDVMKGIYSELDPLPVAIRDLADVEVSGRSSPVATRLSWERLDYEEFERLLFNILSDASDYENPQWLTHTNAPDRGRDISADHRMISTLSGTRTERVIVQAKHWQSRSVAPRDVSEALTMMKLWEPPTVNTLVIATTGRFTADAVDLVERHNRDGNQPQIEMWPDSRLESLLARRPQLVAAFRLRE